MDLRKFPMDTQHCPLSVESCKLKYTDMFVIQYSNTKVVLLTVMMTMMMMMVVKYFLHRWIQRGTHKIQVGERQNRWNVIRSW